MAAVKTSISLSADTLKRLQKLAKSEGRGISNMVSRLVELYDPVEPTLGITNGPKMRRKQRS